MFGTYIQDGFIRFTQRNGFAELLLSESEGGRVIDSLITSDAWRE